MAGLHSLELSVVAGERIGIYNLPSGEIGRNPDIRIVRAHCVFGPAAAFNHSEGGVILAAEPDAVSLLAEDYENGRRVPQTYIFDVRQA